MLVIHDKLDWTCKRWFVVGVCWSRKHFASGPLLKRENLLYPKGRECDEAKKNCEEASHWMVGSISFGKHWRYTGSLDCTSVLEL